MRSLAALAVAALASLTTFTTLGHVHQPAPAHHLLTARAVGTYEAGVIPISMFSTTAPPPDPTPAAVSAAPAAPAAPAAAPAPAARPLVAARPPAPITVGSAQQALINADRAAAGLPALSWSSCLAGIARAQSQAMAARGSIFHGSGVTQDFGCGLGSTNTGENVGYWSAGINDGQLNTMFMNSPEHRANILGPYHFVGTSWVVAPNGYGYITVEFG